ncbi:unnamed protein product, partial [Prorocentrum cordatum]
ACSGLGAPGMPNMFGTSGAGSSGGCNVTFTRPTNAAGVDRHSTLTFGNSSAGAPGTSPTSSFTPIADRTADASPISGSAADSPPIVGVVGGAAAAGEDGVEDFERAIVQAAESARAASKAKGKAKAKGRAKAKAKAKTKVAPTPIARRHNLDFSDWLKPADAKTRNENAFTSRAYDAAKRMAVAAGKSNVDARAIAKEAYHRAKL